MQDREAPTPRPRPATASARVGSRATVEIAETNAEGEFTFAEGDYFLVSIRTRDGLPVYGDEVRRGTAGPIWLPRGEYLVDIHRDVTPIRSYELRVGNGETVLRVP